MVRIQLPQNITLTDLRYLKLTGGTLTGALTITPTADSTSLLKITNAANNFTIFNIDSVSNFVGVGTNAPETAFHLKNNTAIFLVECTQAGGEWIRTSSGTAGSSIKFSDTGFFAFGPVTLKTDTSAIKTFYISSAGLIGVNNSSPGSRFHVIDTKTTIANLANPTGGIIVSDDTTMGAGVGGVIAFRGNYTGTTETTAAAIQAAKSNGTDGQYGFDLLFMTRVNGGNNTEKMRITAAGNVGIGVTGPTAYLHLKAGTATANTAPLKFNSGTLNTTAEAGAMEFLTDALYFTITTGAARKTIAFLESPSFTTPTLGAATCTTLSVAGNQVVGARVVDARIDDTPNSGDATTDGIIAAIQSILQTHGLAAAA